MTITSPTVSSRQRRNLDVNDVAQQLGLSVATIYRWRSDGTDMPKAFKIGGRVRWTQLSVDEFLDAQIAKAV
ncbi:AlpA family transcriptional regulator [Cryobacterium sp. TMS1-13-1]|uniref:helix-turn-helix transcriptional regulator n=1 Tax=Cryobacterium sp. TMS1-13-1 TaxID=1259220 RepID=UPI00106CBC24|nr:helix-turn-helix domain-containing protein [Cryobacterium sp. TMS1-13-1]TFD22130.1 helix-turn-helix domain-containing protein [Cryobacterium sp. TMS1-13-1]